MVSQVQLVLQDHEARKVIPDRLDPPDLPDPLDLLVRQEALEFQAHKVQRDLRVSRALRDRMVKLEVQELQVSVDQMVKLV